MKKILLLMAMSFIGASLQAKPINQIGNETASEINKINLVGIEAVCTDEFKDTLEKEYEKSLSKGFSPDFAIQEAIHRADVICFKTGLSPLRPISSTELIKANKSGSNKEDLIAISECFDKLDNDVDASLKRMLGAVLIGATNSKETAGIAKNLKQTAKAGKIDRESIASAINNSIN